MLKPKGGSDVYASLIFLVLLQLVIHLGASGGQVFVVAGLAPSPQSRSAPPSPRPSRRVLRHMYSSAACALCFGRYAQVISSYTLHQGVNSNVYGMCVRCGLWFGACSSFASRLQHGEATPPTARAVTIKKGGDDEKGGGRAVHFFVDRDAQ